LSTTIIGAAAAGRVAVEEIRFEVSGMEFSGRLGAEAVTVGGLVALCDARRVACWFAPQFARRLAPRFSLCQPAGRFAGRHDQ
jgi:hypothetical protein